MVELAAAVVVWDEAEKVWKASGDSFDTLVVSREGSGRGSPWVRRGCGDLSTASAVQDADVTSGKRLIHPKAMQAHGITPEALRAAKAPVTSAALGRFWTWVARAVDGSPTVVLAACPLAHHHRALRNDMIRRGWARLRVMACMPAMPCRFCHPPCSTAPQVWGSSAAPARGILRLGHRRGRHASPRGGGIDSARTRATEREPAVASETAQLCSSSWVGGNTERPNSTQELCRAYGMDPTRAETSAGCEVDALVQVLLAWLGAPGPHVVDDAQAVQVSNEAAAPFLDWPDLGRPSTRRRLSLEGEGGSSTQRRSRSSTRSSHDGNGLGLFSIRDEGAGTASAVGRGARVNGGVGGAGRGLEALPGAQATSNGSGSEDGAARVSIDSIIHTLGGSSRGLDAGGQPVNSGHHRLAAAAAKPSQGTGTLRYSASPCNAKIFPSESSYVRSIADSPAAKSVSGMGWSPVRRLPTASSLPTDRLQQESSYWPTDEYARSSPRKVSGANSTLLLPARVACAQHRAADPGLQDPRYPRTPSPPSSSARVSISSSVHSPAAQRG